MALEVQWFDSVSRLNKISFASNMCARGKLSY